MSADLWDLDWRPIFLVNIPLGLVCLPAAWRFVPPVSPHPGLRNDFIGIALFGLSILAIVFPLVEGRAYGWPSWTFILLAAGLAGLVLFYVWQRRRARQQRAELLPVALIENRNFAIGTVMTLLFFSGIPGLFMVLALFLQSGFGFTPLESGLTTIAFPVGVLLASLTGGRLANRFLSLRVAAGSLLLAFGMFYLRFVVVGIGDMVDRQAFVPPLLIAGVGLGVAVTALFQTILQGVPPQDAGSGSGALQAFQQVGGAIGVALVGQLFFTGLEQGGARALPAHDVFTAAAGNALWYEIGAFLAVALLVPLLRPLSPTGGPIPSAGR